MQIRIYRGFAISLKVEFYFILLSQFTVFLYEKKNKQKTFFQFYCNWIRIQIQESTINADPNPNHGTASGTCISCVSNRDGNYVCLLGRRHEYTKEECAKQRDVVYANCNPVV